VNGAPSSPVDPEAELYYIERSFDELGDWLNEKIIEWGEGAQTREQWKNEAEVMLPKLDQCERRLDALCYLAYQFVWEFLPAEDLPVNYLIIHRLRRHRKLLLLNGIGPLRQFFYHALIPLSDLQNLTIK
jgi:hypothetical protein